MGQVSQQPGKWAYNANNKDAFRFGLPPRNNGTTHPLTRDTPLAPNPQAIHEAKPLTRQPLGAWPVPSRIT